MKSLFGGVYRGRNVLVTGHTGFKGSWLALWLAKMGAHVTGVALPPPTEPNHFSLLDLPINSLLADVVDGDAVSQLFRESSPEIVFHLAAQPIVRRSYDEPVETFRTNLMGLVNVLEACRNLPSVRAVVVVTSDKCYENREWVWPYRETDAMGGHDPYSASKGAAEIIAHSYRRSFFGGEGTARLATVRAGNVIGGGDWAVNRLLPDIARAAAAGTVLRIRCPDAVRPWQHVLDCLSGYLLVGQRLLANQLKGQAAWNFGPHAGCSRTVREIVTEAARHWPAVRWEQDGQSHPIETHTLQLDSSLARQSLGWTPVWDWQRAIAETMAWYAQFQNGRILTQDQLENYVGHAQGAQVVWATH